MSAILLFSAITWHIICGHSGVHSWYQGVCSVPENSIPVITFYHIFLFFFFFFSKWHTALNGRDLLLFRCSFCVLFCLWLFWRFNPCRIMNSHVRMEQPYILFVILFIRLGLRIYMRGFEMLCYAIVTLCYAMWTDQNRIFYLLISNLELYFNDLSSVK